MSEKLFAFYDESAQFFNPPIMAMNVKMIHRMIAQLREDRQDPPFLRYPREYTLYEIGEFDQENGRLTSYEIPKRLQPVWEIVDQLRQEEVARAQSAT